MTIGVVTHDAWRGRGRIEYSNPSPLDRAHQLVPLNSSSSSIGPFFINTISSRPIQVFVAAPALFGSRSSESPPPRLGQMAFLSSVQTRSIKARLGGARCPTTRGPRKPTCCSIDSPPNPTFEKPRVGQREMIFPLTCA